MLRSGSVACEDVDADHLAVELVIHTASGVLTGRFGPREAVTILATQAPHARARAVLLSDRDPEWSATHAELLGSIIAALSERLETTPQRSDLKAVLSELDRVVRALTTAPSQ
jgi:ethanolamine ammonia-lyase small subunit